MPRAEISYLSNDDLCCYEPSVLYGCSVLHRLLSEIVPNNREAADYANPAFEPKMLYESVV